MNDSIFEISSKLNGIIYTKALLNKSFTKVYEKILEEILELEDETELLAILGDLGG